MKEFTITIKFGPESTSALKELLQDFVAFGDLCEKVDSAKTQVIKEQVTKHVNEFLAIGGLPDIETLMQD